MLFNKRLFFTSAIFFNFIVPSFAINHSLLNEHAENITTIIWRQQPISEEKIFDKLNFLSEEDNISSFKADVNKKIESIEESDIKDSFSEIEDILIKNFNEFSSNCNSLHSLFSEVDPVITTSLKILFSEVKKKFECQINQNREMTSFLSSETENSSIVNVKKASLEEKTSVIPSFLFTSPPFKRQKT